MGANPYKEELKARVYIDQKIKFLLSKNDIKELSYTALVRQCLVMFAVSRQMVEKFIKDFYISAEEVKLQDNILTKK